MPKIRLVPDFPDHVLWFEGDGPVSPEELGISTELCRKLREWYGWWSKIENDGEYRRDETARIDWGFFDANGIELWKQLRAELGGRHEVVFYSHRFNENFETPSELEALLRDDPAA
jgi:hypothetical protein